MSDNTIPIYLTKFPGDLRDKYIKPITYTGLIIVLDSLGMKKRSLEKDPKVFEDWKRVIDDFRYDVEYKFRSFLFSFSDTIMIVCPNGSMNINQFINKFAVDILIPNFIKFFVNEFPLRGSLSYGEYKVGQNLVLGKAVNDASICHDKTDWIGITISPSTNYYSVDRYPFIYYPQIPYKTGNLPGWALNWYHNITEEFKMTYRKLVSENQGTNIIAKYINTKTFLEKGK